MTAGIRRDIQGLRAIAVGAFVLYHLRPEWLPGGFVGVDVFFVISGYLITGSLAAEAATTGRIALTRFWGRRIRSLMPAATVVLIAVAVGALVLLPVSQRVEIIVQLAASALSGQNWVLATESVSYLQATQLPSPLQHFWSLSVEEQFYIVWPVLLLVVLWIGARMRKPPAAALRWLVLVLAAASLAYSVIASLLTPELAYFSTFTRALELLVGAALALWLPLLPVSRTASRIAVVAGLVAVAASLALIDSSASFPGWVALAPTLATAAILWGGLGAGPFMPLSALSLRPFVFVGDISYSLYLWHWPVIVFAATALETDRLTLLQATVVVAVSVVVAWLSRRFVEQRFVRPRPGAAPQRAAFALAGILLATTAAAGAVLYADLVRVSAQTAQDAADHPGARILEPGFDGRAPDPSARPIPDLLTLTTTIEPQLSVDCMATFPQTGITSCEAGDPHGARTVLLVGDSHIGQWLPAFDELARHDGWRVVLAAKQSCPLVTPPSEYAGELVYSECEVWNGALRPYIRKLDPDLVVTGADSYPGDDAHNAALEAGMARQYEYIESLGIPLVAIGETPRFDGFSAPDCLSARGADLATCSREMNASRSSSESHISAAASLAPGTTVLDFDDVICPAGACYAAIGNVISYRDDNHFTDPFARSLAWAVAAQFADRLPGVFP
ncbi:acyltransferase family protein [soil metagenome]